MRAYGHSRRDKLVCGYGCCTTKSGTMRDCRKVSDKEHRKRARQEGRTDIAHQVEIDSGVGHDIHAE